MPSLSEITPSGNTFEGLGGIISEEEAEILGGRTEPSSKSYAGLWIALSVVGGVGIAAVIVFVLYKRGIIKIKGEKNTDKDSKPKASTSESKVSVTNAKPSTTETKVSSTKAKASTT